MKTKRIVIKIGSSSVTNNGNLNLKVMNSIAQQVSLLFKVGVEVVIVSSGAVACGRNTLTPRKGKTSSQIAAIYGQNILMNEWHNVFAKHNVRVGQVLISEDDLKNPNTPIIKGLKYGIKLLMRTTQ